MFPFLFPCLLPSFSWWNRLRDHTMCLQNLEMKLKYGTKYCTQLWCVQEEEIVLMLFAVEPCRLWEWNCESIEAGRISRPTLAKSFLHVCIDVTAAQAGKLVVLHAGPGWVLLTLCSHCRRNGLEWWVWKIQDSVGERSKREACNTVSRELTLLCSQLFQFCFLIEI